ncbi:hypothetical protein JG687_00011630 [Phytophthora cactorum]|uniref:Uncharacterized protein n=1 Tax=Phytophthora cactorum TaxID=29920 RepID=A0A8T1U6J1_9STRA|nr:hypothetical protein JG687_00011630 [Phytophthora cactorum]
MPTSIPSRDVGALRSKQKKGGDVETTAVIAQQQQANREKKSIAWPAARFPSCWLQQSAGGTCPVIGASRRRMPHHIPHGYAPIQQKFNMCGPPNLKANLRRNLHSSTHIPAVTIRA